MVSLALFFYHAVSFSPGIAGPIAVDEDLVLDVPCITTFLLMEKDLSYKRTKESRLIDYLTLLLVRIDRNATLDSNRNSNS